MDALKNFAGSSNNTNNNAANNAGKEDYGDKGLDFLEKKTGTTQSRATNEKITDGARGLYEKATGKHVNESMFSLVECKHDANHYCRILQLECCRGTRFKVYVE
jgi:hypothetical protein